MVNKYPRDGQAITQREPREQSPVQTLRALGFGDDFFSTAASWGLKVHKVKGTDRYARVTFKGVVGIDYAHTCVIPFPGDEPLPPDILKKSIADVHTIIAAQNKAIRDFKGPNAGAGAKDLRT